MKASTTNPVPWRKCEDLNRYALATNVPVTLNGETVIADRVVKTACPHNCYDTCGLLVYVKDEKVIKIEGDPDHPITRGDIMSEGHGQCSEDQQSGPCEVSHASCGRKGRREV